LSSIIGYLEGSGEEKAREISVQSKEGPMLKGGCLIPMEIIETIGKLLKKYQLMPEKGYLE